MRGYHVDVLCASRQVIQGWYIFAVFGVHAALVLLLIRLWHGNTEVRKPAS